MIIVDPTTDIYSGYLLFVRSIAQIPTSALPDDSAYLAYAYQAAVDIVSPDFQIVEYQYRWAVYNLAVDNLLNWCPDQPGVVYKTVDGVDYGYFAYIRKTMDLTGFVAGVVQTASDEGTSSTLMVPDSIKQFLICDLLNLRTPYGREYLAIASRYGTMWGVS